MKYQFEKLKWFDTKRLLLSGFELVDLSEQIVEHAEVPGEKGYSDPDIVFNSHPWVSLDIKPYYITRIIMGAHVGTHIDAPMHAKDNGKSVDKIPNEFVGQAVIIDVNNNLNDVNLQKKINKIDENSIVVIRGKHDYKIFPEHRKEVIRANPKLVVFGDCVNVDGVEDTIQYLKYDIPMIMGANQHALESLNDGDIIFALPLKFVGIEAAPVRLFALKLELQDKDTQIDIADFNMGDDY